MFDSYLSRGTVIVFIVMCLGFFQATANLAEYAEKSLLPPGVANSTGSMILTLVAVFLVPIAASVALTRALVRWANRPFAPREFAEDFLNEAQRAERDARLVRRIKRFTSGAAIAGGIMGVALLGFGAYAAAVGERRFEFRMVSFPVLLGGMGYCFGLAGACAFAPASFLTGPVGRPYLEKIGTDNVLVARLACLTLGALVVVPLLFLTALLALIAVRSGG